MSSKSDQKESFVRDTQEERNNDDVPKSMVSSLFTRFGKIFASGPVVAQNGRDIDQEIEMLTSLSINKPISQLGVS